MQSRHFSRLGGTGPAALGDQLRRKRHSLRAHRQATTWRGLPPFALSQALRQPSRASPARLSRSARTGFS
jgi:hypothetical protein